MGREYKQGTKEKCCLTCGFSKINTYSERVYCDQQYITVAGMQGRIWAVGKDKVCKEWYLKAAPAKAEQATNTQQAATRLKPGALMDNGMHPVIGSNGGKI